MKRCLTTLLVLTAILSSWTDCQAGQINITVGSYVGDAKYNGTQMYSDLFKSAIAEWEADLGNPVGKTVNLTITKVVFTDLGANNGGNTIGASADANGLPSKVNEIDISTNAIMYYGTGAVPANKKDALSVMLHELGHAVGFNYLSNGDGYQKWNNRITGNQFDMFGTKVTLAQDGAADADVDPNGLSHIANSYATDLMNPSVGLGNRRDISQLDLCMLAAAFGYQVAYDCPEPGSVTLAVLGALGMFGYRWRRRQVVDKSAA